MLGPIVRAFGPDVGTGPMSIWSGCAAGRVALSGPAVGGGIASTGPSTPLASAAAARADGWIGDGSGAAPCIGPAAAGTWPAAVGRPGGAFGGGRVGCAAG